jgi:predicted sulfurtransferase
MDLRSKSDYHEGRRRESWVQEGCRKRFTGVRNSASFQGQTWRKKMRRLILFLAIAMAFAVTAFSARPAPAQDVKRMSIEQLKSMLGNPDLVIIDVRRDGDWNASTLKVKGAVREDPEKVDTWMSKYPKDKTLVFYCA